ncbi:hypothetical protein, partial [Escherichia coli]|uniref:hypothetical protein n=1 Tax=Escherichia coli TaxID=562 RepID=UPI0011BAC152
MDSGVLEGRAVPDLDFAEEVVDAVKCTGVKVFVSVAGLFCTICPGQERDNTYSSQVGPLSTVYEISSVAKGVNDDEMGAAAQLS